MTGQLPSHVVGIGASAGGLEALERLFSRMPPDTDMAFVVVQHLSPDFKSLMDELLARWTKMPIFAAEDGMPVWANTIYLMPPGKEMIISDGKLLLTDKGPPDELTLPIDQFFRSLARDRGDAAIAVVLSGTGSDGSRGIRDIDKAGGLVVVQSDETARFDGMPRSAMETGVVDATCGPEEIPVVLLKHIHDPRGVSPADEVPADADGILPLFQLLRDAYGIDFSYYKPATVRRRTERRMQLAQVADLPAYVDLVRRDRQELDALYGDLLIGVTSFFRDEEAFRALEQTVLPALMSERDAGDEFRVWVAACATGEEAYSVAILVHEQCERMGRPFNVKIFATDVHRASLDVASQGIYSERSVAGVSPERLAKYFVPKGDAYQVTPELRQLVVFAPHNLIKDAPFTRLDLITCRNLLIYLNAVVQKKALCLFHFGLKTRGILMLGPSETAGEVADEFEVIDQHWKILRKRRDVRLPADLRLTPFAGMPVRTRSEFLPGGSSADRQLNELFVELLEQRLAPSLLLNEQREIVHSFGDAARYLRLRRGKPSLDVLELLHDDMRLATAGAIHRALREQKRVMLSGVRAVTSDGEQLVHVSAIPLSARQSHANYVLVSFEPAEVAPAPEAPPERLDVTEASRQRVNTLEVELQHTKENLQATIEELEASNEELQAANEEMLASNEELQSTNEELHSVNEELYTVNAEYQKKISELTELTHDMDNLLVSTDVHTIFLDEQLCIRKFTPKMGQVFNLIAADIGRRIDGFVHTFECQDLPEKLANVLSHGWRYEEEVRTKAGDEFLMRILPYRGDTERSGVVMTLVDITSLKQAEARFRNAVEAAPSGMLMVDRHGQITLLNSETERIFGYGRDELLGQSVEMLMPERYRQRHVRHRQTYLQHPRLRPMTTQLDLVGLRKDGSEFPIDVRLSPLSTPRGVAVLSAVLDVTDRKRLESSLRTQLTQRDRFLATLSHELRNPLAAILAAAAMVSRLAGDGSESAADPCGVIRRQASQLAALLDDLLDVSRVSQNKIRLRPEPVDMIRLCEEAIEAVSPAIAAHRHEVVLDAADKPVWVEVDRARMLQVLENLLTNAIKYTPDGGHIQLQVSDEARQAIVHVRDNGRGIAPHQLESIFDMFVQAEDTLDRSQGGMGVGLTLVRSLVELHGGKIEARSAGRDCGSDFVIRLPLTTKRPRRDIVTVVDHDPQQLRLAIVEDADDAREMLAA
ncbi:MAG: chemotaxis protein CheB [Pirellulaceae bacterium]